MYVYGNNLDVKATVSCSAKELSYIIGVSINSIYKWRREDGLPFVQTIDGGYDFDIFDVYDWVTIRQKDPTNKRYKKYLEYRCNMHRFINVVIQPYCAYGERWIDVPAFQRRHSRWLSDQGLLSKNLNSKIDQVFEL